MPNGCKHFCKVFKFCFLQLRWMFPIIFKNLSFMHGFKPLHELACSFFGKTSLDETFQSLFISKLYPSHTGSSNCITNNSRNLIGAYLLTCNVANGVTRKIQFV